MNLLFRTDASVAMGTGHAMRCLALAQASHDSGGRAVFAMAEATPSIQTRLLRESCEVRAISSKAGDADDARHTIALAQKEQADWIVVDGYQFTFDYQSALKAGGYKVLFLDDYGHASRYSADLVLNQNVCAGEELYASREAHTRLLLGPRYALLRREFAKWRDWKREVAPICRRLLVMMGGSDPENLTGRVISALKKFPGLEATVVVGGSNPHRAELVNQVEQSGQKITLRQDVANMPELMATADIAVSAAGSTCWELSLMALPAMLIDVAANQTALAKELDRSGCAVHVGDRTVSASAIADQVDRMLAAWELRQSISERSRALVDGAGAWRVVSAMRDADRVCGLRLRRACAADARLLWEWVNDPDVRAASFSSSPISWETHSAWFAEKLSRNTTVIWIAENEQATPCGQIRFDVRPDGEWNVGVSLAAAMRGRRLAGGLIRLGTRTLFQERGDSRVHAFIKPANQSSIKAFEGAGYTRAGSEQVRGVAALHLIYEQQK